MSNSDTFEQLPKINGNGKKRQHNTNGSRSRPLNGKIPHIIRCFFDKKFKFQKGSQWSIPPVDELYTESYEISNLQDLKDELNAVKSKLNDYQIEDWSAHTRRRNPAGEIAWRIKTDIKAEFVTQAWCKFFECLHQYPIVPGPAFNSVHLCEAPGAFITALNHYLHSRFDVVQWNWLSTTLNPYYEGNPVGNMIMDDRFILHTLDRWMFAKDFTGNIIDANNINEMAREAKERLGDILLITADGSIDCTETPQCQEEIVFELHLAEMCAAFRMLAQGGCFVLKMFTLFEATNVSLMYLLNCVFHEVNVFKPATSRCGSSEVYVICLFFQKQTENLDSLLHLMQSKLQTSDKTPIFSRSQIPSDFLMQLEVCARKFKHAQTSAIESNIREYERKNAHDVKFCRELRSHMVHEYFRLYSVQPIPDEKTILYNRQGMVQYGYHERLQSGSYRERQCFDSLEETEKLAFYRKQFERTKQSIQWPYTTDQVLFTDIPSIDVKEYVGKQIEKAHSSMFVSLHLMHFKRKIESVCHRNILSGSDCTPQCEVVGQNDTKHTVLFETKQEEAYGEAERRFFSQVCTLVSSQPSAKITFKSVPFLTHLSVSVLRILAGVFQTLAITGSNHTMELDECREDKLSTLHRLTELIQDRQDNDRSVLCAVDIKSLHRNDFSKVVVHYNDSLLMESCKMALDL